MSNEAKLNLSKKTIPELKELLDRQNAIIQNKKLVEKLKDKGKGAVHLRDKIKQELEHRNDIEKIELGLSKLQLDRKTHELDKHAEYVCGKDSQIEDNRYRPHRTLIEKKVALIEKSPKKYVEITSAYEPQLVHKPTQCVSLPESLEIQEAHSRKLTEERTKRFLQGLQIYANVSDENEETEVTDEE